MPELRNAPQIPPEVTHVFKSWLDLSGGRRNKETPLLWCDIHGYFAVKQEIPSTWEIDLIRNIDNIYLDVMNGEEELTPESFK